MKQTHSYRETKGQKETTELFVLNSDRRQRRSKRWGCEVKKTQKSNAETQWSRLAAVWWSDI